MQDNAASIGEWQPVETVHSLDEIELYDCLFVRGMNVGHVEVLPGSHCAYAYIFDVRLGSYCDTPSARAAVERCAALASPMIDHLATR